MLKDIALMKTLIALASLLCCSIMHAQTVNVYHLDRSTDIDLHAAGTDLGTGSAYADFPFLRVDPTPTGSNLSGVSLPTTAAITGDNTASQTIALSSTDGLAVNDFVLIDAGLSSQEMTHIITIPDATHISGNFIVSHASGARIRKVFSGYTKYLWVNFSSIPTGGINNIDFIRQTPLPPNVYDMYKLNGTGGGSACTRAADSSAPDVLWSSNLSVTNPIPPVPQYDASLLSSTKNPTNGVSLPSVAYGAAAPNVCVQVGVFFTAVPEVYAGLSYHFYWDY